jgi:TRAP-type C4-dicarboxylate transport system substrate-binding protein
MDRRTLLKSVGLLAAPAIVRPISAENPITLRFHTFVPATSNVYSNVITPWMHKIEAESKGRIRFQGYAAMQMGGAPAQLYDQSKDGVADVVWSLAGYTPGRFLRTEVFELPFFTYDGEGASRAAWEYVSANAADEFRDVKLLACHTHGLNILHMKNKAITRAADLKGMKIRGPSRRATQFLQNVGAIPVGMPLPSIPDALSKGVIDGAIIPWDTVPSAKLDEMTRFHTEFPQGMPGFNNSIQFLTMNHARYESLPADLRKVIDDNAGADVSAMYGRLIAQADPKVRQSVIDRGNQVHVVGKAETEEFIKLTESITTDWVRDVTAKGFDGQKLLSQARELIQRYRPKA